MTLVFAYNADGGLVNGLLDLAHKTFSPRTYACNLCALTYAPFGMKKPWRAFLKTLGAPVEFLHRDELKAQFGIRFVPLPAIFRRTDNTLEVWLDAAALNACHTLDQLQDLIRTKLARVNAP